MAKYFKLEQSIDAGDFIWNDNSPASVIVNNEFFNTGGSTPTTYDEAITLTIDTDVLNTSFIILEALITFQTNHTLILNVSNEINENIGIISGSSISDGNNTDALNSLNLPGLATINLTGNQILELLVALNSLSSTDFLAGKTTLADITLSLQSNLQLAIFLEVYGQLNLTSNTATSFQVISTLSNTLNLSLEANQIYTIISIIDSFIELGISTTLVPSAISSLFNEINMSSSSTISSEYNFTYDEVVTLNATALISSLDTIIKAFKLYNVSKLINVNKFTK